MADADKCASRTVRRQQNGRAQQKYRNNLSLILFKEKRTEKLHKLVGRCNHIRKHERCSQSLCFYFCNSLCFTWQCWEAGEGLPESYGQSLGTHRFCRAQMLGGELCSPGSKTHILATARKQS